ncbi:hypothetical protein ACSLMO_13155 [Flavobacterium columnare]|uniref:hypothetical protein n=1 Tax=Flavobacterium TaxID=237 RepID=UPI00296FF34D
MLAITKIQKALLITQCLFKLTREIGSIINVNEEDEVYTLLFNDGVIGFYSFNAVILL